MTFLLTIVLWLLSITNHLFYHCFLHEWAWVVRHSNPGAYIGMPTVSDNSEMCHLPEQPEGYNEETDYKNSCHVSPVLSNNEIPHDRPISAQNPMPVSVNSG